MCHGSSSGGGATLVLTSSQGSVFCSGLQSLWYKYVQVEAFSVAIYLSKQKPFHFLNEECFDDNAKSLKPAMNGIIYLGNQANTHLIFQQDGRFSPLHHQCCVTLNIIKIEIALPICTIPLKAFLKI